MLNLMAAMFLLPNPQKTFLGHVTLVIAQMDHENSYKEDKNGHEERNTCCFTLHWLAETS